MSHSPLPSCSASRFSRCNVKPICFSEMVCFSLSFFFLSLFLTRVSAPIAFLLNTFLACISPSHSMHYFLLFQTLQLVYTASPIGSVCNITFNRTSQSNVSVGGEKEKRKQLLLQLFPPSLSLYLLLTRHSCFTFTLQLLLLVLPLPVSLIHSNTT